MQFSLTVDNIKCGGCANSIQTKLAELDGVSDIQVTIEAGLVDFKAENDAAAASVKDKLLSMGYPETGSVEGLSAVGAKAKSFVSCAVGKISDEADAK